jgi:hypothetical protein
MLLRVHCSFPQLSLAAVTVAAVALLSCGGTRDSETLAGSSRVDSTTAPAPLASDTGTLDASADKELVCHKGSGKLVPPDAVPDHLAHGDTRGPCTPACPCFSAELVASSAKCVNGILSRTCLLDPHHYLKLSCDLGPGNQTASIFLAQASDGVFSCINLEVQRFDLSEDQYLACASIIEGSGTCPNSPQP